MAAFYCASIVLCLRSLFLVTTTEPGILVGPSILRSKGISNCDSRRIDPSRDYFVQYKTKTELQQTFEQLKIKSAVEKFFHFNKFSFLASQSAPTADIEN